MSSLSWTRVNELFLQAVALPADEQSAFLDQTCGDDQQLRAEVEHLLQGDHNSRDAKFLDPLTNHSLRDLESSATNGATTPHPFLGQRLGPYEIDSLLGTGGMGRVYLARRCAGFEQQVAIKLLKRGMDSDELLRRFQNEIQILAELGKHPHIAALMDANLTENDQPYLIMEYVDGLRIDRYCQKHQLTTTQRLELFLGICEAVQFAHQRTVIHRDLKPSNVLVTADGQPKLIDFGIAKLTGTADAAHSVMQTRTAMRVFTPNYASPEQAAGGQLTTASDVYSLGVLLYELLTGHRPYEIAANSESAAREIMTAQATRPSAAVAANSEHDAEHVQPQPVRANELTGDLDNIVQMAMRKEPERRYATVAELADDIRRHLTQFPVVARPETLVYHCSRFLRRHRVAAAAALLVVASLAAGIFGTTWQWIRAEHEAQTAVAATERAQRAANVAREQERAALWQVYRANIALAAADLARNSVADARRRLDACASDLRSWEWRYFDSEVRRRHAVLRGHTQPVNSFVFFDEGSRLLTSSLDGTLRTWNIFGGSQLTTHRTDRPVEIEACTSGGQYVALINKSEPAEVAIWNLNDEQVTATISESVAALAIGANGTLLATLSGDDQRVRLWNAHDGSLRATLPEPANAEHIAMSPDGSRLAYAHAEGIVLWNIADSKQVALLDRHTHPLTALSFNGNSSRLLVASHFRNEQRHYESQLAAWDSRDGNLIFDVTEFPDELWSAKFNHQGDRIATASSGSTMRLRDGNTGEIIKVLAGHQNYITDFTFSANDKHFVSRADDHTVRLWDGRTGELQTTHFVASHPKSMVGFGPDSKRLATCTADGSLRVWQINPTEDAILSGHDSYVYTCRWLRDGKQIVSGSWDGTIRTWDAETRKELSRVEVQRASPVPTAYVTHHPRRVLTLSVSPDDSQVAGMLGDGSLRTWQIDAAGRLRAETERIAPFTLREQWRVGMAFLPQGQRILRPRNRWNAVIWNQSDDSVEILSNTKPGLLQAVAVWPNRLAQRKQTETTLIALGLANGETQLWHDGPTKQRFDCQHSSGISALAFSADGQRLATGGDGNYVRIWNTTSGEQLAALPLTGRAYALAFTPDGSRLAVGASSNEIQLWDTNSWTAVAQLSGHKQYVHSLEFSPDGRRLLSASGDKTIRIWEASSDN